MDPQQQQPQQFNIKLENAILGMRIHNIPECFTKELLYTKIFKELNIDIKNINAFSLRSNKERSTCIGDAFVYFKTEKNTQDAMHKIIGAKLYDQELNCSLLMDKKDLTLKNNKNICVKSLRQGTDLRSFFNSLSNKNDLLSVLLKQNKITKKLDGYACFKTTTSAQEAIKGVTINNVKYQAKLLEDKPSNANSKFAYGSYSKNIRLEFETPLDQLSSTEYENLIRQQVQEKFNLTPTSVFVWGQNAKHSAHSAYRINELGGIPTAESKCKENTHEFVPNRAPEPGYFDCYLDKESNCPKLLNARCKAFVCFKEESQATEFVNSFFNNQDETSKNFDFNGKVGVLKSCVPNTKIPELQEILREKIATLPQSDKSYIYLGKISQGVDENKIKSEIENLIETQVLSIKLNKSKKRTEGAVPTQQQEFSYATLHLKEGVKSEEFISNFKKSPEYRKKFENLFKFANFLKPQKVQSEIKEKNQRQKNINQQLNMFPWFNMNLLPYPLLQNFPPQFPMQQQMNRNYQTMNQRNQFGNMPQFQRNLQYPFPQPNQQFREGQKRYGASVGRNPYNNQNPNQNFNNNNNNNNMIPGNRQNRKSEYPNDRANSANQNIQKHKVQGAQKDVITPIKPDSKPAPRRPDQPIQLGPLKLEEILKIEGDEEKKKFLGNRLYPKIVAYLPEDQKELAKKISGMILDFDDFPIEEIVNIINKPEELKIAVDDVIEVINS